MKTSAATLLFVVFALIQVATYLAVRRQWLKPAMSATIGVIASIIVMTMISLAQENGPFQAIVVGVIVGALFSSAILAIAWYFHSNEMRAQYIAEHTPSENVE